MKLNCFPTAGRNVKFLRKLNTELITPGDLKHVCGTVYTQLHIACFTLAKRWEKFHKLVKFNFIKNFIKSMVYPSSNFRSAIQQEKY